MGVPPLNADRGGAGGEEQREKCRYDRKHAGICSPHCLWMEPPFGPMVCSSHSKPVEGFLVTSPDASPLKPLMKGPHIDEPRLRNSALILCENSGSSLKVIAILLMKCKRLVSLRADWIGSCRAHRPARRSSHSIGSFDGKRLYFRVSGLVGFGGVGPSYHVEI